MPNLLIEIGTEEIPAGYLAPLLDQLARKAGEALDAARLDHGQPAVAGTPRRLVLFIPALSSRQKPLKIEVQGPPADIAFEADGAPSRAGTGFAQKFDIQANDLQIRDTAKGKYSFAVREEPGSDALTILPPIITDLIGHLTAPKSMHWRDLRFLFARPIRWLLALFGDEVINLEIADVLADRFTYGHRFLAGNKKIEIPAADFELYKTTLKKLKVIVDPHERRKALRRKLAALLKKRASKLTDLDLLDEVNNMLEYPNAAEGAFDESFLTIPQVAVEAVMKVHQKYFPVRDEQGNLLPYFLFTLDRDNRHVDEIRQGNESVLRARLADGRFFWTEDCKTSLEDRVPRLDSILFHEKLGSYFDRTDRVQQLAWDIGGMLGENEETRTLAARAAHLSKTDLLTQMVAEFPSLQGKMGYHYALNDGEPEAVALAIMEHYMPRSAADGIPSSFIGAVLSLADKTDTVAGCFAAGLIPTGSQDPYALRRAVIGIIRIVLERRFRISLTQLFRTAQNLLPEDLAAKEDVVSQIVEFLRQRLYQLKLDAGSRYDILNAAMAAEVGIDNLPDFQDRLAALERLATLPEWDSLVTLVERTHNISRTLTQEPLVRPELFSEPEESQLWAIYKHRYSGIRGLTDEHDYVGASLVYTQTFAEIVHSFFDKVFVNVEDPRVRTNRMALVKAINLLYSRRIADLSKIVPPQQ